MPISRRQSLLGLTAASLAAPLLFRPAMAQTPAASSAGASDYVQQTLELGAFSMMTSQIARERVTDERLAEFAGLEINEQQAVASVLAATEEGQAVPGLGGGRNAQLQQLNDMAAGPEFDEAYLALQYEAHVALLDVQRNLADRQVATVEAVTARLSEQAILSHLAMLNHLRARISAFGDTDATVEGMPNVATEPFEAD